MGVEGLDHVAITVADVEATVGWYLRVLGAEALYLDLWQAGTIPIAMLQIGASRLSVHAAAAPAAPHAAVPTTGSADLCFRFGGTVSAMVAVLEDAGVAIVDGPVSRPASNGVSGTSVYCRDPDGNLVELLTTSQQ
ncbi:MAG: Virulence protein [Ilumatobacteraceae bacterium]|nr:Virulence protein [Ilumatobacteraceae bacterium]